MISIKLSDLNSAEQTKNAIEGIQSHIKLYTA